MKFWLIGFCLALIAGLPAEFVAAKELLTIQENCRNTRPDEKNWDCARAGSEWLPAGDAEKGNYVAPLIIAPKGNIQHKQVLILSPKESSAYDIATRQIVAEFRSRGIKTEFTLVNYLGDEKHAKYAIAMAEKKRFDMIYSMGSKATQFIAEYYAGGKLPVVTVCSKDPVALGQVDAKSMKSGNNIAYTSLDIDAAIQLEYIDKQFLSGLDTIAVLYDHDNPSSVKAQVEPMRDYLRDKPIRGVFIEVDFADLQTSLHKPLEEVVKNPDTYGNTAILITGSTELYNIVETIHRYAKGNQLRSIPVLSVTPGFVAAGEKSAYVSIGVSFRSNAQLAADYGMKVLLGEAKPAEMPVGRVLSPDISINFLHAPAGSKIPFSMFEAAGFVYDHQGKPVRIDGQPVKPER